MSAPVLRPVLTTFQQFTAALLAIFEGNDSTWDVRLEGWTRDVENSTLSSWERGMLVQLQHHLFD